MAEGAEKAESQREEREGCSSGRDRNAQNNTETGEPSASSEWEDAHSAVARKQAHDQQLQKAKDALRQQMGMRKDLNRSEMIQRDYHSDFLSKVGSKEVVSVANGERPGFFCSVSGHTAADSLSYLDHINGRKRALFSLSVCGNGSAYDESALRVVWLGAQSNGRWACQCA
jgi:hypothetical protein